MSAADRELVSPSDPTSLRFKASGIEGALSGDPERYDNGFMRMAFSDTTAKVTRGEEELGVVVGVIGGGVEVRVGERSWFLSPQTLWDAGVEIDRQYLASLNDYGGHVPFRCPDDDCGKAWCDTCDGTLFLCTLCHQGEGELDATCIVAERIKEHSEDKG